MIFSDTSVVVASGTPLDPRHTACVQALAIADAEGGASAAHSLAEIYSILSGRPGVLRMPPAAAWQIAVHTSRRFKVVTLEPAEYLHTIEAVVRLGLSGGIIYDALLMACARKVQADRIYTLNPKHFRLVAPDLASRVVEP
jgi:predicted nucleic acid-binding protein